MAFPVLLRKLFDNLGLGPKLRKDIIPTDIKVDNATSADSATKLATAQNIKLTGDVTGSASFDGTKEASVSATLTNSGVSAGNYGQDATVTTDFGDSITVPMISVDSKGRVTLAKEATVTLPGAAKSYTASSMSNFNFQTNTISGTIDNTSSSGSGNISSTTYTFSTLKGIAAGNYTVIELLGRLVNMSHTHKSGMGTVSSNCNCDCDCQCNCNCQCDD